MNRAALMDELREHWPALLGVAVFLLALWAQTGALVGVFYDDGIYVSLAKSLAEGTGYRSVHLPDAPAAVHYPPLYPFTLSLWWRLWPDFPANVALLQLADAAWLGVAAWMIGRHARLTEIPAPFAALALGLAFSAFPLLTLVGVRFSEPLFLAIAAGAVWAADSNRPSLRRAVWVAALVGIAMLTRSIGVALVVGIPVALWLSHRRAALLVLVVPLVIVSPWIWWLAVHGHTIDPLLASNYGTYGQFAGQAGAGGMLSGLNVEAFSPFTRLLFPPMPALLTVLLGTGLFAVVATGGVRLFPRAPALVSVLAVYVGIVAVWPYTPDRFVWIVLPWVSLLGAAGAVAWWGKNTATRIAVAVLGVVCVAGYGPREVRSLVTRGFAATARGPSQGFELLTAAITTGVAADAVVASDGEALVWLYTGRRTVPLLPFELDGREAVPFPPDVIAAYWCRERVTHVGASTGSIAVQEHLERVGGVSGVSLERLFTVQSGPLLYRFTCAD